MGKKNNIQDESSSVIDEINGQLEDILQKKREEIKQDLEKRIKKEESEARRKIESIEKDLATERKTLAQYKTALSEIEKSKEDIRNQIREHLRKAMEFQAQIEKLTGKTLNELKNVNELNQQLDDVNKDTITKVTSLKNELEEKYGIVTSTSEDPEDEDVDFDMEKELSKLRKIKELLSSEEVQEERGGSPQAKKSNEVDLKHESVKEDQDQRMRTEEEEIDEEAEKPEAPEKKKDEEPSEEESLEEESVSEHEREKKTPFEAKSPFADYVDNLDKYHKKRGRISFFKRKDKIIFDGESIISTLNHYVSEGRNLFTKLSQTKSPKEQFFIKQEIIKQQDDLREYLAKLTELWNKKSFLFANFTQDIMNVNIIKDLIRQLNEGNWSNAESFSFFKKHVWELGEAFEEKISSSGRYAESLAFELGVK